MKNNIFIKLFLSSVLVLTALVNINAQEEIKSVSETIEFKVYGNCGMCKERIESALEVKGVNSADWNPETKMVIISFVPEIIAEKKLHQIIADVGHDTDKIRAKDETYKKLHGCCKYERAETKNDDKQKKESHKH